MHSVGYTYSVHSLLEFQTLWLEHWGVGEIVTDYFLHVTMLPQYSGMESKGETVTV